MTSLVSPATSASVDENPAGHALLSVTGIFWLIALVAVILRILAARRKRRQLAIHDYCIFVAFFFAAVLLVCFFLQVFLGGTGLPENETSSDALVFAAKVQPLVRVFWSISNTAVKLSFLHFFATVFTLQKFRRRFIAAATACVAFGLGIILMVVLICQPYAFFWDTTIPGGHCGDQTLGLILEPVFNLATDLLVFGLPIPILWQLKGISRQRRGGLIMIFSLGSFVCCVTTVRIITAVHLTVVQSSGDTDATYWIGVNAIFLGLEPCLGITAACIPTLPPLWRSKIEPTTMRSSPTAPRMTITGRENIRNGAKGFTRLPDPTLRSDCIADSQSSYDGNGSSGDGIRVTTDVHVNYENIEMTERTATQRAAL